MIHQKQQSFVNKEPATEDVAPSSYSVQDIYHSFLSDDIHHQTAPRWRGWLEARMNDARDVPCELPADPGLLYQWIDQNIDEVGERYLAYLARRKAGGKREMFSCRSHALNFLAEVAPTKLVDGAWLYSSLPHASDHRYAPLVQTYLEELGLGKRDQNHVALYRKLLRQTGADGWDVSAEGRYLQGAIQLSLGYYGADLVPEMIGFNLGYEQLPFHLHVTSYELDELGIDPYYFTVHVTVDNASTGHAKQAVEALHNLLPSDATERDPFYARVRTGFVLNDLGDSSTTVAEQFSLDGVMIEMLRRKARYGRAAHADYCKIAGRTVNDWLAHPLEIPALLTHLKSGGWILGNRDPEESRFWQLIQGSGASMFGVFNSLEMQLVYDWIAGDCPDYLPGPTIASEQARMVVAGQHVAHRVQKKLVSRNGQSALAPDARASCLALPEIEKCSLDELIALMSPANHHSEVGLAATARFAREAKGVMW